jgi:hypothetical protein
MIRRIIKQTDKILDASLPAGHLLQQQLSEAIHSYCMAIKLLNSHYLLSDDEIEQFQDSAIAFFENWIAVFGNEGVTNYIHLLGSGHMKYFLKEFGCLYLYSQQGWEAWWERFKQ